MNVSSVWPTLMGLSATSSASPTLTAYRPRSGYHTTIVPATPLSSGLALSPDTVTSAPGSSAPPSWASKDTVPERSELILYLWLSMLGGNIVRDSRLSRAERAKSPGALRTLTSMLASVRRRPTFFSALSSENLPLCWSSLPLWPSSCYSPASRRSCVQRLHHGVRGEAAPWSIRGVDAARVEV